MKKLGLGLALVALAAWILLVVVPRQRWITGVISGAAVPALLAAAYVALIAANWRGSAGGFATLTLIGSSPVRGLDDLTVTGFGFTIGGLILLPLAAPPRRLPFGQALLQRFHQINHRSHVRLRDFGHFLALELGCDHRAHIVLVRVVVFVRLERHGKVFD